MRNRSRIIKCYLCVLVLLDQRARAAFRALFSRCSGVNFLARAFPPFRPPNRPSATAAGFLYLIDTLFYAIPFSITKLKIRTSSKVIGGFRSHSGEPRSQRDEIRCNYMRGRPRQGYYGSVRLDAPASVPPLTHPTPQGSFASRFSSREAVAVQLREMPQR